MAPVNVLTKKCSDRLCTWANASSINALKIAVSNTVVDDECDCEQHHLNEIDAQKYRQSAEDGGFALAQPDRAQEIGKGRRQIGFKKEHAANEHAQNDGQLAALCTPVAGGEAQYIKKWKNCCWSLLLGSRPRAGAMECVKCWPIQKDQGVPDRFGRERPPRQLLVSRPGRRGGPTQAARGKMPGRGR